MKSITRLAGCEAGTMNWPMGVSVSGPSSLYTKKSKQAQIITLHNANVLAMSKLMTNLQKLKKKSFELLFLQLFKANYLEMSKVWLCVTGYSIETYLKHMFACAPVQHQPQI